MGFRRYSSTCIDGLNGFPEAIAAVFPEAKVQRGIVLLVRNSLNYTSDAIESLNRSFRKVIKTKGVFPSQDSLIKLLYLALQRTCRQWIMPIQHWKAALACFAIEHPNSFLISPLHKFLDTPTHGLT
ncbi:transposase [Synechocystis salina LEGE 06155]|nr:transposase [Synechocystis salina LEGE 06155]